MSDTAPPPPGVSWPWVAALVTLAATLPPIARKLFGGTALTWYREIRRAKKEDRKDAIAEWQTIAEALGRQVDGLRAEVARLTAEVQRLTSENSDFRQEILDLQGEVRRLSAAAA